MTHAGHPSRSLWIGVFPAAGLGTPAGLGEGIWRTRIDLVTGRLEPAVQACETPAPSFLALDADHRILHATGETSPEGVVTSWALEGDDLRAVCSLASMGDSPTHVVVAPGVLLACNYGDGTVLVADLRPDGVPQRPTRALPHVGHGPDRERQLSAHAHSTTLAPGGGVALVCDLGTDELRRVRITPGGQPTVREDGVAHRFRPGSGPRHAAFRQGGAVLDVVTELSAELVTLAWDGESATETGRRAVQETSRRRDDLPSHLAWSTDHQLLYVGNRGPGTLSVFARPGTRPSPTDPGLVPVGEVPVGSPWPRHFAVIPGVGGREFIVVAGERASALHVLVREPGEALPHLLAEDMWARVPAPACVLAG